MRRAIIVGVVLLLALFAAKSVVAAQKSKGPCTLAGVVLGPDDKPAANASVTYQSSGGNAPHAVRADGKGRFTIKGLRADNYDIRATHKGIFSEWEKNVNLRGSEPKNITLRLIYSKEMPKASAPAKKKP